MLTTFVECSKEFTVAGEYENFDLINVLRCFGRVAFV